MAGGLVGVDVAGSVAATAVVAVAAGNAVGCTFKLLGFDQVEIKFQGDLIYDA